MKNSDFSLFLQDLSESREQQLQDFTFARIGLKKAGPGICLKEVLAFKSAHAAARDAIFTPFLSEKIQQELSGSGIPSIDICSKAENRTQYLQRPDSGRILSPDAEQRLKSLSEEKPHPHVSLIIADGLSPLAVNRHSSDLIKLIINSLTHSGITFSPVILLHQGRVAASDSIGKIQGARLVVMLIGERPGLSSPDSMGAYLTYNPEPGLTDEARNCVSNIHPKGLPVMAAADKLNWLIRESLRRKISGTKLKDEMKLL